MDSDPNHKPSSHPQSHGHKHERPSSSELLSSAKLVAEAAQSTFRHESHKVDKGKVAGAAGDLLEAACHYGKLEEKGFGKYVDKAEDYLHNYSSHSTAATHGGIAGNSEHVKPESHGEGGHSGGEFGKPDSYSSKPDSHGHGGHSGSEGGFGDYMKLAQGFMKSDETSKMDSHGGHFRGGYGDYLKMTEGFLKRY